MVFNSIRKVRLGLVALAIPVFVGCVASDKTHSSQVDNVRANFQRVIDDSLRDSIDMAQENAYSNSEMEEFIPEYMAGRIDHYIFADVDAWPRRDISGIDYVDCIEEDYEAIVDIVGNSVSARVRLPVIVRDNGKTYRFNDFEASSYLDD